MYEYIVIGYIIGLRSEIEYFFNQPSWSVASIPDPEDTDPARYAILAVLTQFLVLAFNRLIERGLPRGSPAIITPEIEAELRAKEVILEKEPEWAKNVRPLEEQLIIPGSNGAPPDDDLRSERFAAMNIVVEEPHVLFV